MKDKRNEILAKNLIDYSVKLKKGEILYLEIKGIQTIELGKEIVKYAFSGSLTATQSPLESL